MRKVIVLEFNELTPALMDRYIEQGALPGFKRLRDESLVAITDAGEDPPYLEPWIQWVTVHTGLSYAQHQVFDLGDGPKLRAPRIWDIVSGSGDPVWICGSMNAAVQSAGIRGSVLPDPWSTGLRPIPDEKFAPFFDFISTYVLGYSADKTPVTMKEQLRFVRFMLANGLSLQTVIDTIRQLASELTSSSKKWRRAAILDGLMWDVFKHEYRRINPKLATFFLNSTAHYQHYYWRNMEPDAFDVKPDAAAQLSYADAIFFGYRQMDEIVQQCFEIADDDTSIILCTALSQQPLTQYDAEGGRQLFKPIEPKLLFDFAGISGRFDSAAVMAEDFRLFFEDESEAEGAETRLAALALDNGMPLLRVRRAGRDIYAGCAVYSNPQANALVSSAFHNRTRAFRDLFYPINAGIKSGMHHRDGILWMRVPGVPSGSIDRTISLEEIAPTILELCDVETSVLFSHPPIAEIAINRSDRRQAA